MRRVFAQMRKELTTIGIDIQAVVAGRLDDAIKVQTFAAA